METEQKTSVQRDLRRHQRLLVPEGRKIMAEATGLALNGNVTVIGLGGMFIRTRHPQPHGRVLLLDLTDPFISFQAQCTVRYVSDRGMGVEITGISAQNEQKLKLILQQLKP